MSDKHCDKFINLPEFPYKDTKKKPETGHCKHYVSETGNDSKCEFSIVQKGRGE